MRPGGDIALELERIGRYKCIRKADVVAMCRFLKRMLADEPAIGGRRALQAILLKYDQLESIELDALELSFTKLLASLSEVVDRALLNPSDFDADGILAALTRLAGHNCKRSFETVVKAVHLPFAPDHPLWSRVVDEYYDDNPLWKRFHRAMRKQLSPGHLGLALLEGANGLCATTNVRHTFDWSGGIRQLELWIRDTSDQRRRHAVSAAEALQFIDTKERIRLVPIALEHPNQEVRFAAACSAANLYHHVGLDWLAENCRNFALSDRASQHLSSLGFDKYIPEETTDPSFQARAEFARWLVDTQICERVPEVDVVDARALNWPPDRTSTPVWLLRFCSRDEHGNDRGVGLGFHGHRSMCHFDGCMESRPPDEIYAIYCFREMCELRLIATYDVPTDSTEYDGMLRQHGLEGLGQASVACLAELSPKLHYGRSLVAVAQTRRDGTPSWLALDGVRSRWYPSTDMRQEECAGTVLAIHIGRVLLGLHDATPE
jgi:hypothetical protein